MPPDKPTVLITGASGFIGSHLARTLAARGYRVRIAARSSSDLSDLDGIDFDRYEADLTNPISLIEAVKDVDYVYHLGGLIKARTDEEFIDVNGDGTKNLCAAAKVHAPKMKRFLYMSSMAASGPGTPGKVFDETLPASPLTPYGASKRLGEKWVQQFDFLWTIVRPSAVYGPGDKGMLEIFQVIKNHVRPTLGNDGMTSVAYVDNLVEGCILAAERPEGVQQIFFLADEPPVTKKLLARMIQTALDTWAIPIHFPAWAVRIAARISESVASGFNRVALFDSHKANELLAENWACKTDKAKLLLGYSPKVPTDIGLKRTALWYKQKGWL